VRQCAAFSNKIQSSVSTLFDQIKEIGPMVRIGSRTWTPAQITRLIELIDDGSSAKVVAVSLERYGGGNAAFIDRAIQSGILSSQR
jgi:hypothetical protein